MIEPNDPTRKGIEYDNMVLKKFGVLIFFILICLFCKGNGEEFCCPYCENSFFIILEPYEAKEIAGGGWTCNNCGKWHTQGSKCVWCNWPRHKKK